MRPNPYQKHKDYIELTLFNQQKEEVGFVKIDFEDFELVKKYRWRLIYPESAITVEKGKSIRMHHLILNAKKGQKFYYINGNRLDNRKKNLTLYPKLSSRICEIKKILQHFHQL
jgi:hypothetical protein